MKRKAVAFFSVTPALRFIKLRKMLASIRAIKLKAVQVTQITCLAKRKQKKVSAKCQD